MKWETGSYWDYTLGDQFVVSYSVVGSRVQLVERKRQPCHVVAISAGRIDDIPYTYPVFRHPYPVSYFDVQVMNVTKKELGVVMGNKIVMNLPLLGDTSSVVSTSLSYPDGERGESFTKRVGKETVKIKDTLFENCDKIITKEP